MSASDAEFQSENNATKIITTEWVTYEELERRAKERIPSLDETKVKTFIIEPFLYKKGSLQKTDYYKREDYKFM